VVCLGRWGWGWGGGRVLGFEFGMGSITPFYFFWIFLMLVLRGCFGVWFLGKRRHLFWGLGVLEGGCICFLEGKGGRGIMYM
jgi:hypothetical protein